MVVCEEGSFTSKFLSAPGGEGIGVRKHLNLTDSLKVLLLWFGGWLLVVNTENGGGFYVCRHLFRF